MGDRTWGRRKEELKTRGGRRRKGKRWKLEEGREEDGKGRNNG